jgi:hypothetical protein
MWLSLNLPAALNYGFAPPLPHSRAFGANRAGKKMRSNNYEV